MVSINEQQTNERNELTIHPTNQTKENASIILNKNNNNFFCYWFGLICDSFRWLNKKEKRAVYQEKFDVNVLKSEFFYII